MKKKLFNKKEVSPQCGLCVYGQISPDGESVLCFKKGIMQLESSCHSFKYDPLKRKPRKAPPLENFDKSDFEL